VLKAHRLCVSLSSRLDKNKEEEEGQLPRGVLRDAHLIRTSIHDKYSGSTKINTHLDHISHCKTTSGTHGSNKWTHRVFFINTHRD